MVGVAQLVRAPGCGPGGRGFKSHHSPRSLTFFYTISGCGAVRLAHLLWEQGVGGSNPLTPTRQKPLLTDIKPFFIEGLLFYHIDSINIKYMQKRDTDLRDTLRDTSCLIIHYTTLYSSQECPRQPHTPRTA